MLDSSLYSVEILPEEYNVDRLALQIRCIVIWRIYILVLQGTPYLSTLERW